MINRPFRMLGLGGVAGYRQRGTTITLICIRNFLPLIPARLGSENLRRPF